MCIQHSGRGETRTHNLLLAKEVPCPFSYTPGNASALGGTCTPGLRLRRAVLWLLSYERQIRPPSPELNRFPPLAVRRTLPRAGGLSALGWI